MSSDADDALVVQYVYTDVRPLIIALACETGFYVLSISSFATSTYVLARKGFKTRAILMLWITTFIMFTVSTCHLVLQWVGNMDFIMDELWSLASDQSTGSNEPAAPNNRLVEFVANIGNSYLPMINYVMSDGIALWRVWIMWGRSVKVLIFPVLFTLGSIVWTNVSFYSSASISVGWLALYVSTLATNIIATTLIAVKAWQHRRLLRSHLNNTEYRSQALSVLALLVESGTLYCVIWIISLVSLVCSYFLSDNTVGDIGEILPEIMLQVSGIYPTAVIALAALQRTTWDMSIGNDMSQNASHTEMRFVARATRSGTSTTQTGAHHPTPSVDQGSHPHASEIEAREGEV